MVMLKPAIVLLQPSIVNGFFGYFIPYMLNPRKIQIVKAMLDNVPAIAPFEFAKGTKIPKINKPRTGPPITPNSDNAA